MVVVVGEKKKTGRPRGRRDSKLRNRKVTTRAEILAELERLEREELRLLEVKNQLIHANLWEYFKPFAWQQRVLRKVREKLIVVSPSPNKIGKTALVANIICSWLEGYEAWNEVDIDHPEAVKVKGKHYRASSLGTAPPVKIRLTGEDWNHHLGQTVVPELKKWFPKDQYDTKKNTNGVEYFWTFKNGSTLELLTHGMEDDLYESWFGHGWIPDEPPPEKKFTAMARGLFGNRGKILMPTTPLKESWILDELILANRSDVAVIDNLTCLDNENFKKHDDKILDEMGLATPNIKQFYGLLLYKDDKGEKAEKYLSEFIKSGKNDIIQDLYFLKFAKDTPLDEKPSRFFGTFKKLIGLVIKNFDKSKHIIADFPVPTDWPVTPMIDLHLNKPHAISFFACDKHNRHYAIDEYWVNCAPEEIADLIIRAKILDGWNITNVYIDPLSKGDDKFMTNRVDVEDSFTIISNKLVEHGIYLQVASKDKESGFRNIRSWLEGPNKIPIVFFLDSLQSIQSNTRGIVYDIQRLCFDDNGKIEKKDDDFMENFYRYTLTGTEYVEEDKGFNLVGAGTSEGWMGA